MSLFVGTREAARLAGISYRMLDYWIRRDVVRVEVVARGSGTRRRFSFEDVVRVAAVAALRKEISIELSLAGEHVEKVDDETSAIRIESGGYLIVLLDVDKVRDEVEMKWLEMGLYREAVQLTLGGAE